MHIVILSLKPWSNIFNQHFTLQSIRTFLPFPSRLVVCQTTETVKLILHCLSLLPSLANCCLWVSWVQWRGEKEQRSGSWEMCIWLAFWTRQMLNLDSSHRWLFWLLSGPVFPWLYILVEISASALEGWSAQVPGFPVFIYTQTFLLRCTVLLDYILIHAEDFVLKIT